MKIKKYKNKKFLIIILSILILMIMAISSYSYLLNNKNVKTSCEGCDEAEIYDEFYEAEDENIEDQEVDIIQDNKDYSSVETVSNITGNTPYYIKVNKRANTVTIYAKDDDGNYTVPFKVMICSTGLGTPSGKYKMPGTRRRWHALFGNVYGQYVTSIVGNFLFHSVPYLKMDSSTLEYWEYDKLGSTASRGCVRLTVADAQWIYNNISGGTIVEFYSDSDPGPLGKPSAQKISSNIECRGWDPTDYTEGNPWRNLSISDSFNVDNVIDIKDNEDKNKSDIIDNIFQINEETKNDVEIESESNTESEPESETEPEEKSDNTESNSNIEQESNNNDEDIAEEINTETEV